MYFKRSSNFISTETTLSHLLSRGKESVGNMVQKFYLSKKPLVCPFCIALVVCLLLHYNSADIWMDPFSLAPNSIPIYEANFDSNDGISQSIHFWYLIFSCLKLVVLAGNN